MRQEYYQIYLLLDPLDQWNPRLNKIRKIVEKPTFQYTKEEGSDILLAMFLRSSYWLDKELFCESYLYKEDFQNLTAEQMAHFQMVDIGAALLNKGFPLKYEPAEYMALGPNQLGPYVKTFVDQCQKRYNLFYKKTSHRKKIQLPKKSSKTR